MEIQAATTGPTRQPKSIAPSSTNNNRQQALLTPFTLQATQKRSNMTTPSFMIDGTNLDLQFSYPHQTRILFGDEAEDNPWDKYDWNALLKIPHATGLLSLVGSGWIISRVLCDAKRRGQVYHRIMLALSTFDFFLSFWMFMGRWAQPAGYGFTDCDSCHGSIGTCEASGFFIMLGFIAIPLYNVVLSVYYYLVICKNWREQDMKNNFEKYMHCTIPTIAFILAIIPLPLDLYNPYYSFCSAAASHYDVETDTYERGTLRATRAYVFINLVVVGVCTLCMTGIMIRIYVHVRHTEKRSSAYQESFTSQPERACVQRQLTKNRRSSNTRQRSNAVAIRALLYTLPFYCTWIIPTVWFTMGHFCFTGLGPSACLEPRPTYVLQVWTAIFLPLQGFFNAIIYDVVPYLRKIWGKRTPNNSEAIASAAPSTRSSAVLPDPSRELRGESSSQFFVSLKEKMIQSINKINKSFSTSDKSSDKSSCDDHHHEGHLNLNEEDLSENKIIDLVSNNAQDRDDIVASSVDGQETAKGGERV